MHQVEIYLIAPNNASNKLHSRKLATLLSLFKKSIEKRLKEKRRKGEEREKKKKKGEKRRKGRKRRKKRKKEEKREKKRKEGEGPKTARAQTAVWEFLLNARSAVSKNSQAPFAC